MKENSSLPFCEIVCLLQYFSDSLTTAAHTYIPGSPWPQKPAADNNTWSDNCPWLLLAALDLKFQFLIPWLSDFLVTLCSWSLLVHLVLETSKSPFLRFWTQQSILSGLLLGICIPSSFRLLLGELLYSGVKNSDILEERPQSPRPPNPWGWAVCFSVRLTLGVCIAEEQTQGLSDDISHSTGEVRMKLFSPCSQATGMKLPLLPLLFLRESTCWGEEVGT